MSFGAQVWDEAGNNWIDIVQPSWVLDVRSKVYGDGTLNYHINTTLFKLRVVVVSDCNGEVIQPATHSINGGMVTYSASAETTFLIFMEAK